MQLLMFSLTGWKMSLTFLIKLIHSQLQLPLLVFILGGAPYDMFFFKQHWQQKLYIYLVFPLIIFFAVSLENLIFLSHLRLSFVGLVTICLCSSFSWLVRLEIFITKEKYSLVGRGLGNHEGFGRNRSRSRHQWNLPSCRVLLMSKSLALFWLDCSSLCFASNCFCSSVRTQQVVDGDDKDNGRKDFLC